MNPSANELRIAAEWLAYYDEDTEEHAAMMRVAKWLEKRASAKEETEQLRSFASARKVSVATVRQALKKIRKDKK